MPKYDTENSLTAICCFTEIKLHLPERRFIAQCNTSRDISKFENRLCIVFIKGIENIKMPSDRVILFDFKLKIITSNYEIICTETPKLITWETHEIR